MSRYNDRQPGLPSTAGIKDMATRGFLDKLKEAVEIRTGRRGDPLDRSPTLRELMDSGVVRSSRTATFGYAPPDQVILPSNDLTIPPAPTNVQVASTTWNIAVTWSHRYELSIIAFAEVHWAKVTDPDNLPSVDEAVMAGIGYGIFTTPVEPGEQYIVWVRYRTHANIVGPWHSLEGTFVAAQLDPTAVLELLSEQITESQLYQGLNDRINLVDDPATGLVQVTSQIASTVGGHTTAIEQNTKALGDLGGEWTVKIDTNGHVAGIGLATTVSEYDGTVHSAFGVSADTFFVAKPGARTMSMVVTDVEWPGEGTFPTVTMNGAYIQRATITNAHVQNLDVSKLISLGTGANKTYLAEALIQDGAIGNAKIGNFIQSNNWSSTEGWHINKNGVATFRSVYARGDIEATSIKSDAANIISTLMLQDEAVTVGASMEFANVEVQRPGSDSMGKVTIDSKGNNAIVLGSVRITNTGSSGTAFCELLLRIDGVDYSVGWVNPAAGDTLSGSLTFPLPNAGKVTVELRIANRARTGVSTSNHASADGVLMVLGFKR